MKSLRFLQITPAFESDFAKDCRFPWFAFGVTLTTVILALMGAL